MIPKIIHYCWFGGAELPDDAKKCIASWQKYAPEYEIRRCDETNFDGKINRYVAEAYRQKKYAFVSDYARFWLLYRYGGLYFDTDVELIKPIDPIAENGPFMAIEKSLATQTSNPDNLPIGVAPGLGLGVLAGNEIVKELIDIYDGLDFNPDRDGTIVSITTDVLRKHGFKNSNTLQVVDGITIYPDDYFCPMDSTTGLISITDNTVSIHRYTASWMDHKSMSYRLHLLKNKLIRIFGPRFIMSIAKLIKR